MEKTYSKPKKQGLYDPRFEHENCGIGLIVDMKGRRSHSIIKGALEICVNLDHRGGCGCDPITGDGAGLFIQLPHKFFKSVCAKECGFEVPEEGDYGVGFVYLSKDAKLRAEEESTIESVVSEQLELIGWRDVPVNSAILGKASSECEPLMRQFFVKRSDAIERGLPFERKLYIVRRLTTHKLRYSDPSNRSIRFLHQFIVQPNHDLQRHADNGTTRALFPRPVPSRYGIGLGLDTLTLFHQHLSQLAESSALPLPLSQRRNNTVRGNENWLHARQMQLAGAVFGEDLEKILPIIREDGSDSQKFDNCLEFLVLSGRSLAHAMMMMVPEPGNATKTCHNTSVISMNTTPA